jgi:putative oxidoreductase
MDTALLIMRVVVGLLLAGHGAQKLFGWFGGYGPSGTGQFMESLGYRPGRVHAVLAGLGETLGGVLRFLTPLAAAAVIAVMINAIVSVHRSSGLWVTEGGYEYNLVLIVIAFAIAAIGPGTTSVDNSIGWHLWGLQWGLGALLLGGLGAVVTLVARDTDAAEAGADADAGDKETRAA